MSAPVMFRDLPKSRVLKQAARLNLIAGNAENAYKFGPEYSKMEIFLINNTSQPASAGLKKLWRAHLPTLKFHNEKFEFILKRIKVENKEQAQKCPAKIVFYDSNNNKGKEIDCLSKNESEILQEIIKITQAQPVAPSDIPKIEVGNN